jgi:hypothetical protein
MTSGNNTGTVNRAFLANKVSFNICVLVFAANSQPLPAKLMPQALKAITTLWLGAHKQ